MDAAASPPPEPALRVPVGRFVVDAARGVLLDADGQVVELRPQAFEVLRHLARHPGRVVGKDELMAAVWPRTVVTDDSLVQAVGDARRAIGDAAHTLLRTVPRRGYLLVPTPDAAPQPAAAPATHGRRWLPAAVLTAVALLAVAAAAWQWAPGAGLHAARSQRPSVAVLAFRDPQAGADGQALARAFAEDLLSELARGPELRVVAHESSFRASGMGLPLADIGARLRSRYLVDGTVERDGERLHVVVRLLDSESGHVLWSAPQDVELATAPSVRRALAGRIAGSLLTRVRVTEERRALRRSPRTLDVVVLTEHGKAHLLRYTGADLRQAREFFGRALALDPEYAPAWAYLGITNMVDIGLRLTGERTREHVPEMLDQMRRAIALDPEAAIAWAALAQGQAMARDYDAAMAAARRCFDASPNEADCFHVMGKALLEAGDPQGGARMLEQALDRNPMPRAYLPAFYATALWGSGRLKEAVQVADECLAQAPDFWRCRQDRIAALVELGRLDEARAEAARLRARAPRMRVEHFTLVAPAAAALSERRMAAARAAGMPSSDAAR